jgi:amino acid transporter
MAVNSDSAISGNQPKKTLTLTGVTINAMALIAPGAFLWITYQLQASATDPKSNSVASDMWPGIVLALLIAFLTAISYAELAKIYPDAGFGSAYYFAEKAFLDREQAVGGNITRWARISKLVTGWAAHLFYWVYPGVMVTFMAILISYIAGLFGVQDGTGNPGLNLPIKIAIALGFAGICGYIGSRGITGSTLTSLIVNIIQLVTLVFFSVVAIAYRVVNPDHVTHWAFSSAGDVIKPHIPIGILVQSTIAILILVGFESCTALGAEAINAKRDVPKGVLLSLVIQGLFAYLFEYFAASFALGDSVKYVDSSGKAPVTLLGMDAAGKSQAPIGDMMKVFGDSLLHNTGFALTVIMAITVALAILGTTLACMNTAVRVSFAMAKDKEMPEIMGVLHSKHASPTNGIWILTIVSAIIGAVGVYNTVVQTGLGIASNLGTFVLYALICVWTILAFAHRHDKHAALHMIVPAIGLILNIGMISTIFYLAFAAGGDSAKEANIALGTGAVWAIISIIYVVINNARTGRSLTSKPVVTESVV